MAALLKRLNDELAELAATARASLVQIQNGGHGAGAGTIWHADGLILTNAHVADHRQLRITIPDGRTLPARLLAHDPALDLAALVVDAKGLPVMSLGDSRRLSPGQWVMALGHPWGVEGALTAGVVIGMGKPIGGPISRGEWVTVSLHLRPGHSGGPLVDVDGKLVGINTMMAGPDVGMAVPVHVVKAFLRQLLGKQSD
ncbi:MAG TPA: trypsin-like peptidase domain-containing protein [Anaerolineales bacterium]|nr:trypsin-like peptidase domain-containing protein [Anaerolineales bacterium]